MDLGVCYANGPGVGGMGLDGWKRFVDLGFSFPRLEYHLSTPNRNDILDEAMRAGFPYLAPLLMSHVRPDRGNFDNGIMASLATELAQQHGVLRIEGENEHTFTHPDSQAIAPLDSARLLQAIAPAIRAANPSIEVLACCDLLNTACRSMKPHWAAFRKFADAAEVVGGLPLWQGAAIHPYTDAYPPEYFGVWHSQDNLWKQYFDAIVNAVQRGLHVTEFGWRYDEIGADGFKVADYVKRMLDIFDLRGVKTACLYTWSGPGPGHGEDFGIFGPGWTERPVCQVIRDYTARHAPGGDMSYIESTPCITKEMLEPHIDGNNAYKIITRGTTSDNNPATGKRIMRVDWDGKIDDLPYLDDQGGPREGPSEKFTISDDKQTIVAKRDPNDPNEAKHAFKYPYAG